ncbi:hypothetical protein [Pseudomonas sp. NMS19W]|uniref:hypothetical protein n=1 Tax=Pseudomonas sp. NMS19W TaxID=3079768 RepID=UPI003F65A3C5
MKEITIEDLEVVSGGFGIPGAAAGAVVAGAGYIGYEAMAGGGSMNGFIGTVAGGAAVGFFTGPAGISASTSLAIGGGQASFYGGMMGGMITSGMDAAGTNYNR